MRLILARHNDTVTVSHKTVIKDLQVQSKLRINCDVSKRGREETKILSDSSGWNGWGDC